MKIGTLTFHKSYNYGSFLQAYALQQVLLQKGYETEIIDFEPKGYDLVYKDFLPPTSLWNISYDYVHFVLLKKIRDRKKSFESAKGRLLRLSKEKYNHKTGLSTASNFYDVIICGSDQIWNSNAKDFDLAYMLQNVERVKKISYAVSINKGRYENDDINTIRECLGEFSAISVREQAGKDYLEDFLGAKTDVDVVLDPTFLLKRDQFDLLAGERRIKEPYIFLFSIHFKDHVIEAAKILTQKYHMPVYTLFSGRGTKNTIKANKMFHMVDGDVGPECFLNMIKYAEYVVADSFHGTAFSIIFRKNFYAVYGESKDVRLNHILSLLHLENCYVRPTELMNDNIWEAANYEETETELAIQIDKSNEYIEKVLGV